MQEEQDPSQKYIKGFNAGYNLQKEDPELLDLLISADPEFIKALKAGKEQLEMEVPKEISQTVEKEKHKSSELPWLSRKKLKESNKHIGLNKDRHIEPEI